MSSAISYPDYIDFRDRNHTFSGLVACQYSSFGFSPSPTAIPQMKFGLFVSGNFFHDLGIEPTLGRAFRADEDKAVGRDAVVILGYDFWVSQFDAKPSVLGSSIRLNGIDFTIVGVAPTAASDRRKDTRNLASALTLVAQSEARDASTIAPAIRQIIRQLDANMPVYDARTMEDIYTQRAVKTPNMMADTVAGLGLMGLVLSMVGLYGLVAYSVSRRTHEIGIRMAIGADRAMVIRMVLRQGLVLGAIGVTLGLAIGIPVCKLVTSSMLWVATFDATTPLLFLVIAAPLLLISLLATYAPAYRASRIDPMKALRDE